MIVLYMNACPPGVRGDVTKWLMEIQSGVYVGQLSLRAREALWQRICKHCTTGSAIMVCSARNEQGFVYYVHNSTWQTVDFDGITLMRRPLPANNDKNPSPEKEETPTSQSNLDNSINHLKNAAVTTEDAPTIAETTNRQEIRSDNSNDAAPVAALTNRQETCKDNSDDTATVAEVINSHQNPSAEAPNVVASKLNKEKKARKQRIFSKVLPYEQWPPDAQLPNDFVVLDLETTGLNPDNDSIIEAACVKVRSGLITEEFHALIGCDSPVPSIITELTGIDDALLSADGEKIQDILPKILTFIGSDVIVGHSTAFDIRFLQAACVRLSLSPFFPTAIDTVALARERLEGKVENFRLETLARHFRILEKQAHRALPDARATAQLFLKLNEFF